MTMKTSQDGLDAITSREGKKYLVYKDEAGLLTGGIGHKLIPADGIFHAGDTLTDDQINIWFGHDISIAENTVNHYVVARLGQNEFDALVSATFNVGSALFKHGDGSDTNMCMYLNEEEYAEAADEFLKWIHIHVNGQLVVSARLQKRRASEREQFLS